MVNEGKAVTSGGETKIADPAGGLIQNLANRIFDAVLASDFVHDRQRATIRIPVGVLNIVQQIAGSIGADGKLG